jgi:hypothetical protein
MRLKHPAQRTVLAGFAVLYAGLALGLPLVLTGWPLRGEPNLALVVLGAALLVAGFVGPLLLLARAAVQLQARRWPYLLPAALLWPIGTVFALTDLWERCRSPHPAGSPRTGGR